MKVEFEKDYLKELYNNGKTTNKKYVDYNVLAKKYIKCINILIDAKTIYDVMNMGSLHYKKLKGDMVGKSSIRIDKKYRIEFREIVNPNNILQVEICSIIKISNHYEK